MRIATAAVVVALGLGSGCTADAPGQSNGNCTKAIYDPCNDEHDCTTGLCEGFATLAPVCTQLCTPGDSSCPDQNGNAATCDTTGFCRPPMARACTIIP